MEIVILWVYYTIPFGFSLFRYFRHSLLTLLNYFVWLRITDEGSAPEMRIWSILLINLTKNGVYILVEVSFYITAYAHILSYLSYFHLSYLNFSVLPYKIMT